jgi:hypothetical protein
MSTGIGTVFMAAACFLEEQAKVQAELDEVIGRNRGISTPHVQFYRFNDLSPLKRRPSPTYLPFLVYKPSYLRL